MMVIRNYYLIVNGVDVVLLFAFVNKKPFWMRVLFGCPPRRFLASTHDFQMLPSLLMCQDVEKRLGDVQRVRHPRRYRCSPRGHARGFFGTWHGCELPGSVQRLKVSVTC